MGGAVTLAFCSIQRHLCQIWHLYSSQSPDIRQNSDGSISDSRISGQSFINENCHNSRTSHDIDIKLGLVPKLDKKNTSTSKRFDDDVMPANYDVIVFFPIYGQFAAIRKPDSRHRAYKTYIFISSNLVSFRTWKQNWKISNTAAILLLWVKVLILQKNADFLQEKCWHQQN